MVDPIPDKVELSSEEKESIYVHKVYDQIAKHFSNTRYNPWPVIKKYLEDQEPGCIGADIGCGNGKYLGVRSGDMFVIGSDRSPALVEICNERGFESMTADNLNLPYRDNVFDFAISIAVIHHFSTESRRVAAIKEILRTLRKGGTALIYVWALEQDGKRKFEADHQDYLVPWVTKSSKKDSPNDEPNQKTYQR
ncbi:tRNA methyltransferase, has a role in tRNA modification [Mycoemilia scoparia]|uniref:tRNA methyltransferase, has a role in tRNA modification n=1 Tax=Mycoemilia scoparia TaxID=417184 RepID=A0A9W8DWS4_9FUNG|nr:tRNA methyltransferase, has a role in tRNA modification [Mycoemilia scoparia]